MIKMRQYGQSGNALFQIMICYILADKTGQKFVPPKCLLDKSLHPVQWSGDPIWELKESQGEVVQGHAQEIQVGHHFDFNEIDKRRPVLILSGYFQRYCLFRDYKDKIRNDWLKIPDHRYVETDQDAVYVHVRRMDYVGNPTNRPTEIDEFAECVKQFPDAKRIVVVTDNPRDPFIQGFDKIGLPWSISGKRWDEDFLLLASCRWLTLSQSTYGWWAAFLGRPEKIVCSVPVGSSWREGLTRLDKPNLYVDDEPGRWAWLKGD